jgi:hypothetical protein
MKVPDRGTVISSAAFVALAISLPLAMTSPAAAASRPGPSPFCLKLGSSNGPDGVPEVCGYFDYRQCLKAGADMHIPTTQISLDPDNASNVYMKLV